MHLFNVYVKVNADVASEKSDGDFSTDREAREVFRKMEAGGSCLSPLLAVYIAHTPHVRR